VGTLVTVNAVLAGFFAFAAIHYAVQWGLSRHERILLVFSVQCALYAAFSLAISSFFRARTIPDAQATLDRFVTLGVIVHALILQFYAELGGRRDRAFRALVMGGLPSLPARGAGPLATVTPSSMNVQGFAAALQAAPAPVPARVISSIVIIEKVPA